MGKFTRAHEISFCQIKLTFFALLCRSRYLARHKLHESTPVANKDSTSPSKTSILKREHDLWSRGCHRWTDWRPRPGPSNRPLSVPKLKVNLSWKRVALFLSRPSNRKSRLLELLAAYKPEKLKEEVEWGLHSKALWRAWKDLNYP